MKIPARLKWIARHPLRVVTLIGIAYLTYFPLACLWYKGHNPSTTSLMRFRTRQYARMKANVTTRRTFVPLRKISRSLIDAVIVAEDGKFYHHHGFDFASIRDAYERNRRKGKIVKGGSTISQQLAKNLFLSPKRSIIRKLKEAYITVWLEVILGKRRILELYLNYIEWGRGVYGAEAASRRYFGTSASALSEDEAVRLAAMIPSPLKLRPYSGSRGYIRRMDRIWDDL